MASFIMSPFYSKSPNDKLKEAQRGYPHHQRYKYYMRLLNVDERYHGLEHSKTMLITY
jgi:hypothetical protein